MQVFVSVKGVEWNVYRRYTEFREFHRQLQKHLPEVAAFNFPPKKAINNKVSIGDFLSCEVIVRVCRPPSLWRKDGSDCKTT